MLDFEVVFSPHQGCVTRVKAQGGPYLCVEVFLGVLDPQAGLSRQYFAPFAVTSAAGLEH